MVLYGYYSKYGVAKEKEQVEPAVINIVVVNPLGYSSEVFPIPLDENKESIEDVINQQFQVKKVGVDEDAKEKHDNNVEAIELQCVV